MPYLYQPKGCSIWYARVYLAPGRKQAKSMQTRDFKVAKWKAREWELNLRKSPWQPRLDATVQQTLNAYLRATQANRKDTWQQINQHYANVVGKLLNSQQTRQLTPGELQTVLSDLKVQRKWSDDNYNHYVRFLRGWARWIKQEGYTEIDLTSHLRKRKLPRTTKPAVPWEMKDAVLTWLRGTPYYHPSWVCFYTGFRLGTIQQLNWEDWRWKDGIVIGRGEIIKDGQPLTIPIHPALRKVLAPIAHPTGRCFPTLSKRGWEEAVSQVYKALGIWKPRMAVHAMRHSFARRALKLLTAEEVQYLLGHSDLKTTMLYLEPTPPNAHKMAQM